MASKSGLDCCMLHANHSNAVGLRSAVYAVQMPGMHRDTGIAVVW